ncbi:DUF2285 domain-containing protein [Brucella intermedia]|uniref:DUF2285 domain-containing protein n=1 Tax=Brucella intermedia TaxID=94625 RepID=UPI002449E9DE|nr:DUF2285 domain-containing protein [Brucella intermedia]WGG60822.1 DUF2285 domain-containing protein [Brucella intermedia]
MRSIALCLRNWSAAGGCDFAARPRLAAADQPIFWSEHANTGVLRLAAASGSGEEDQATLRTFLGDEIKAAPEALHILRRSINPDQHLMIDPNCRPDDPLEARISISRDGLDRLAALERLLRQFLGYKVPADRRMTDQQRRRLKSMFRAVDARQHNASQREIAGVLYGVERVASEHWKTSSLRDTVSELLKYGDAMIGGGYLKLLRFRRRL